MKLLVTSLPDLKKMNPQRYHHILYHLSKKHEITLICVNAWQLPEKKDEYLKELLKNIDYHHLSDDHLSSIVQELYTGRLIKRLKNDIEFSSFDAHISFNSLLAGYTIPKKMSIPSVLDICDDIIDWIDISSSVPSIFKPAAKSYSRYMLRKNIRNSKHITYSLAGIKEKFDFPDSKSTCVPNGVDSQLFVQCSDDYRQKLDISKDDFVIGFVGYLGDWIDLATLFEAIKILSKSIKIKVIIAGTGKKHNEFLSLPSKYNINDSVVFVGDLPYLEVPKFISSMDACMIPFSKNAVSEGALPIKLFEYMSCEKPVISTLLPGIKSIMGDLVFYYETADDLAKIIRELYHDTGVREAHGKKGRTIVYEKYSWKNISNSYENILTNVKENNVAN